MLLLLLLFQGFPLPELFSLQCVNSVYPVNTAVQIKPEPCLLASKHLNTVADCRPGRPYGAVHISVLLLKMSLLIFLLKYDFFFYL